MQQSEFYHEPGALAATNRRLAVEARLKVRAVTREKGSLVERMADAMLDISATGQPVDTGALTLRGFTLAQLTEANIARARDMANTRAVRIVG